MSLSIGTFLQDRYEILDRIGSGGMSLSLIHISSAYTSWNGKTVKLWAADVLEGGEAAARPGQVVKSDKHSLLVQTGDGILSVRELQMEGKKRMDIVSFLRGYPCLFYTSRCV